MTHLIYLLVETAKTEDEKWTVKNLVTKLLQTKPRSAIHGDTLLHLCVSRLNTIKGTYFSDDSQVSGMQARTCTRTRTRGEELILILNFFFFQLIFPNLDVIKLLLECGAPVNAINQSHSTPLHIAANTYNFCAPVSFFSSLKVGCVCVRARANCIFIRFFFRWSNSFWKTAVIWISPIARENVQSPC